jgi:hypothetical protein
MVRSGVLAVTSLARAVWRLIRSWWHVDKIRVPNSRWAEDEHRSRTAQKR